MIDLIKDPSRPPSLTQSQIHDRIQARITKTSTPGLDTASTTATTTEDPILGLKANTRVRWHTAPVGTLFGRVAIRTLVMADGWLYVNEETSGQLWALNPATDFIAVLSAP